MDPSQRDQQRIRLQGFLHFPGEDGSVDYKSALPFVEKDEFCLKLVRHTLGMSNAGGGFIVIGFEEKEGAWKVDDKLAEAVWSTYDTTRVSQFVDRCTKGDKGPRVVVEKLEWEGRTFPMVRVDEFEAEPYFCKSTMPQPSANPILKEGALYFRDEAAKTVELSSPDNFKRLLARAVAKRQHELLDSVRKALESMRIGEVVRETPLYLDEFEQARRRESQNAIHQLNLPLQLSSGRPRWFAFWHCPVDAIGQFTLPQLRDAARKAERPNTGLPMGLVNLGNDSARPVEDGIRMAYKLDVREGFEYWFLHRGGGFFLARDLGDSAKNENVINFDTRLWRMAEAVDHALALYQALGVSPDNRIRFDAELVGIKDASLSVSDPRYFPFGPTRRHRSEIAETTVMWSGTLGELAAQEGLVSVGLVSTLLEYFGFFAVGEKRGLAIHAEYKKSRAR